MTTDPAYWDEQAATFDEDPDHGLRAPAARGAWASLLARHMPPPPARVVDIGCGTGTLSVLLAQAGHDVTGVDYAPRMLDAARVKASVAGVHPAFLLGDASAPPVPQEAFDVVLARHVLWGLPEPEAALAAWCGLLTSHGRLLLIEGRWHTGFGLSAEQAQVLVHAVREEAQVEQLTDPTLWGGPLRDERYILISCR